MKKVLFVAHVDSHIRHFHIPYLKYFKEKGYEVHVVTSNDENETFPYCDVKHVISIKRNPFKMDNIKAIKQLKKIINDEKFDLIHCHTPMGGVITRLAAKKVRKNGTKVFYTAHGFHFYKGAPKINWMIYYPIEKYLSKYTDVLITINHEDYELVKNNFKAKRIELVHGMGVDDKKFNNEPLKDEEYIKLKKELNIQDDDFVMMYVAELNKNKNQIMLIEMMKEIIKENPKIKLFLVGKGKLENDFKEKIKDYNLQNNIIMLGYRNDVNKLLKLTNLCVATSKREGLPINLVESELSGVPVVATKNRGHIEVIKENINGFIIDTKEAMISKIFELYENRNLLNSLKNNARNSVMEFSLDNALKEGINIYESELQD